MSRDLRRALLLLALPAVTRDEINEREEDLLLLEPSYLDGAIVGVAERPGLTAVIYSAKRCIELIAKQNGWTHEAAAEFFDFNTRAAYMGPTSPLFI